MSVYIAKLRSEIDAEVARFPRIEADLRQRFIDWYAALPEVSRNRAFAMVELERALATQGRYLSAVLLELGWRRGRKWSSQGQYSRFWVPPSSAGKRPPV